jgi:NitT/TauT family transport system substrate-binding protein
MRTRNRYRFALLLTIVALALIPLAASAEDITLRLKWLHGAQFAGYYAAVDQGFYEEEGLTVHFIEGASDYEEYEHLVDGPYDFLVGDALRLLQAVERDLPVIAIAAIYQFDPLVLFSLADREITTPYHLVGKHIMSWNSVLLEALLERMGMSLSDVVEGDLSYDITKLWDGTYDVWMGYLTNEVVRTRNEGYAVNIIYPTDYGVHVYGDVLVTRQLLTQENPDLVVRFLRASLRGWEYVSSYPIVSASLSLRYNAELRPLHEIDAIAASLPLLHGGVANIGWMHHSKWQAVSDLLLQHGHLELPVAAADVFTLQFLEQVYQSGSRP